MSSGRAVACGGARARLRRSSVEGEARYLFAAHGHPSESGVVVHSERERAIQEGREEARERRDQHGMIMTRALCSRCAQFRAVREKELEGEKKK